MSKIETTCPSRTSTSAPVSLASFRSACSKARAMRQNFLRVGLHIKREGSNSKPSNVMCPLAPGGSRCETTPTSERACSMQQSPASAASSETAATAKLSM